MFSLFAESYHLSLVSSVIASRQRLIVIEHDVISNDIIVSGFRKFEAEIHVVIGDSEILVEASDLFELSPRYHEAGCRNRKIIIVQLVAAVVIAWLIAHHAECMHRACTCVDYSAMLNQIVLRIYKLDSDGTCMSQLSLSQHPAEPFSVKHFCVILEEQILLAFRICRTEIAHVREVELFGEIYILSVRLGDQLLIQSPVLIGATVVDYNNLIVAISGEIPDRFYAASYYFRIIL